MVSVGGFSIIASIVAILGFLIVEVAPLFTPSRITVASIAPANGLAAEALALAPDLTRVASLGRDGVLRIHELPARTLRIERASPAGVPLPLAAVISTTDDVLAGTTTDGRVLVMPLEWTPVNPASAPAAASLPETTLLQLDPAGHPLHAASVRRDADELSVAAVLADDSIVFVHQSRTRHFLTGAVSVRDERRTLRAPRPARTLLLDRSARHLHAVLDDGRLASWILARPDPDPDQIASIDGAPITALALLVGDQALVIGQADGSLGVWTPLSTSGQEGSGKRLTRIHAFEAHSEAIEHIVASRRNRTFLVLDAGGTLGLHHSTSERVLWQGRTPLERSTAIALAPKADAMAIAGPGRLGLLDVHNPHPDASFRSLFGRVWYEGREASAFVWQSSSGNDDFEPKLSLVPLLVGTLKGTLYSLLLAVPLAVLGALYTSQFMHPRLQRAIKPTVELMASLPSVVLGFLAGLWLAPLLERSFPGVILLIAGVPLFSVLGASIWNALPLPFRSRLLPGAEIGLMIVLLSVGGLLLFGAGTSIERSLPGNGFPGWLYETFGIRYDQRNAVVVGLAMGFAVIPIIFTISEDAFASVPPALTAGSQALGASRWQTVVHVVLPSASPGIFSGVMVGFGRAIGETMIVLMATGNTPILDWSPFNGFRTLSANIAVEIPEAPVGSTLYRTLFLAALLLFAFTFVVNTVAEVVRQRLRRRFSHT